MTKFHFCVAGGKIRLFVALRIMGVNRILDLISSNRAELIELVNEQEFIYERFP